VTGGFGVSEGGPFVFTLAAAAGPAAVPGPPTLFWLVTIPFLAAVLVLAVVAVTALLRAERADVLEVFAVFAMAFVRLVDRLARRSGLASAPRLDTPVSTADDDAATADREQVQ